MPVITLTSDYGLVDHRVASTKGSLLSLNEEIKIVDISHEIEAYNLQQAAYIIRNAYRFFPEGTVHIISVDSFYRKGMRSILCKVDNHYFIAADNGILSLIFYDIKPESIYEITFNNRFADEAYFPTNDVFVPAAVHLCNGGLPEVIGRPCLDPKEATFTKAVYNKTEKMIIGEALYIDNFGNIVSNIDKIFFLKSKANFKKFIIRFRSFAISHVYNHYTEFIEDWEQERDFHGKAVALFNDVGLLELSIYKGNKNNGAKTLFGMNVGEKIYIEFYK